MEGGNLEIQEYLPSASMPSASMSSTSEMSGLLATPGINSLQSRRAAPILREGHLDLKVSLLGIYTISVLILHIAQELPGDIRKDKTFKLPACC